MSPIRARIARLAIVTFAVFGAFAAPASALPEIKHVFIIVLENENADDTFGAGSPAPYLATTLKSQGAFVPNYYGTAHLSLPNYIAMVSGQSPNVVTQTDCLTYIDLLPGLATSNGQVIGQGCVYPVGTTQTIANQLEDSGFTWKGYMEDLETGTSASPPPGPCRHPSVNSVDSSQSAEVGDQYASRHNPFVYFHSIIDFPTCARNVVDFTHLAGDLASESTTPNYAFITPNLCDDGHDSPCVDGRPGGLVTANQWLTDHVPAILSSPAYNDHGLLIVTFDEADAGPGGSADASACCNEQPGPNTVNPGGPTVGPGGGRVGAVMLSPCITAGTSTSTAYNHYSMLRSIEDLFGLPHLGFAGQSGLVPFGDDVFTKPDCGVPPAEADLSITKSDSDDPATVGQQFSYTLTAQNNGPDTAQNVVVTDALPGTVTYNSSSASQGSCSEAAGTVTCDFGDLANQDVATATITVTPTQAVTIQNTGQISSDTTDSTPGNNSDTEMTQVNAPPAGSADLSITKSDSADPVMVNQSFTYNLAIHNGGPDTAQDVRVTDALPNGVALDSVPAGCSAPGGTVTCDLGNLTSGANAAVAIPVTPIQAGLLSNTAEVSAATADPASGNDSDTETTQVNAPGGGGGASAGGSAMTLRVKPRRTHTGKRVRFRFLVTSSDPNCVGGVKVQFTRKSRLTNSAGKARIKRRFSRRKKRFAYASKPGCGTASVRVRIRRA